MSNAGNEACSLVTELSGDELSTTATRVRIAEREAPVKLVITGFLVAALITACASVPPEFGTSMQREADGIAFLHSRHQESVRQLADIWYEERMARLDDIRTAELANVIIEFPTPTGAILSSWLRWTRSMRSRDDTRRRSQKPTKRGLICCQAIPIQTTGNGSSRFTRRIRAWRIRCWSSIEHSVHSIRRS